MSEILYSIYDIGGHTRVIRSKLGQTNLDIKQLQSMKFSLVVATVYFVSIKNRQPMEIGNSLRPQKFFIVRFLILSSLGVPQKLCSVCLSSALSHSGLLSTD